MESNTDSEYIQLQKEKRDVESGKKEKELDELLHISAKPNIEFGLFNFIIINSIYKNNLIMISEFKE